MDIYIILCLVIFVSLIYLYIQDPVVACKKDQDVLLEDLDEPKIFKIKGNKGFLKLDILKRHFYFTPDKKDADPFIIGKKFIKTLDDFYLSMKYDVYFQKDYDVCGEKQYKDLTSCINLVKNKDGKYSIKFTNKFYVCIDYAGNLCCSKDKNKKFLFSLV